MPKDNPENYKRMIEESIAETVREPLIVLDADLRVISANKSFYRNFKVNPKETQGRLIYDLGNRQWNIPKLRKLLEEILPKSTTIENYEVEHDFKTIGPKTMLLNARRLESTHMILLAIEDITERKKVEEGTLREEGEKWNSLMKNTDDVIMIVNDQGIIQYINRTIPPYSPEETIGKSVYEYVIKEQRDMMSESLKKVFKTGEPDSYEISSNIPKIGIIWFSTKVVPIKQDNVIKKIIMISTDVTERKKAEEKLRKSVEEWRQTFDSISDMIFIMDRNFIILRANCRFAEAVKMKPEEIAGRKCYQILHKSGKHWASCPFEKTLKDGKPHTDEVDDPVIGVPLLVTTSPIFNEKGELTGAVHVARDISKMKKADDELRKRTEKSEKFAMLGVGRELKMVELKKKIEKLEDELNNIKGGNK